MIAERVTKAWPTMANQIGGFSGFRKLNTSTDVITAGTDGAGTVAILAALLGRFDVIGENAAAMSLVDVYVNGSQPVALLDVIDVARLDPDKHIGIIDGLIRGCKLAGDSCILLGGETAELSDTYKYPWMVQVNTTVIGVPNSNIITGKVQPGQPVYGWRSEGPASNGFSLARKVFDLKQPARMLRNLNSHYPQLGETLADALLKPAPIWINQIEIQRQRGVKFAAHAHITGGGLVDNIPRVLPDNCKVVLDRSAWERPLIFQLIEETGKISADEMDQVFNQGMMVVSIVDPDGHKPNTPNIDLIGQVEQRHDDEAQVQFTSSFS